MDSSYTYRVVLPTVVHNAQVSRGPCSVYDILGDLLLRMTIRQHDLCCGRASGVIALCDGSDRTSGEAISLMMSEDNLLIWNTMSIAYVIERCRAVRLCLRLSLHFALEFEARDARGRISIIERH